MEDSPLKAPLVVLLVEDNPVIPPVPDVPTHIPGVMNIRGDIVSVVGLKQLRGLEREQS